MKIFEGLVGEHGEIFVDRGLMELLDLRPGDKVEFVVSDKGVIFRKKRASLDLLDSRVSKVNVDELLSLRDEFEEEMRS